MPPRLEHIPLPLVLYAPSGFHVLPRVGYANLDLLDSEGRSVGEVRGSTQRKRIMGIVPVDTLWRAELVLRNGSGDERTVATAAWEPSGGRRFKPLEVMDPGGQLSASVDDWGGFSGHLAGADGERIARIDSPNPLSTAIRFHNPSGGPACDVERRGARKGLEIFDWSGPEEIDARLVLAWVYAMGTRGNH